MRIDRLLLMELMIASCPPYDMLPFSKIVLNDGDYERGSNLMHWRFNETQNCGIRRLKISRRSEAYVEQK